MKKTLDIIGKVITALIFVFTIFVMIFTVISVNTIGKQKDLFGYQPYIVLSDSMKDTFAVGDLSVSKKVDDVSTLKPGDIITFKSIDPNNYGEIVTHKIREITTYEGEKAFVTYGTTTGVNDTYPVPFENVVGQYQFRLPKMGYFFEFLRSPAGYFTVILIPFLLLIGSQVIRFFKLVKQYKAEQQAEIAAQKEALQTERMETLKMKEELEKLRASMAESMRGENSVSPDDKEGGS